MPGKIKPEEIVNKEVITKEGKKLGMLKDLVFEVKTGEIVQFILVSPTQYALSLNLEQTKNKELLVNWNSVMAITDFIVVNEEDIL
jgi:sporulation protein YlmC with PRC-barrel domain